jgi:hypothetical protein
MATEVNPTLAGHAQGLLVHQVRLRKALADPGLPPEPKMGGAR